MSVLFRKKSLTDILKAAEGHNQLKRTLGPMNLILLGIGAIIGAGLFSLTGMAAANYAGPAVTISFVVAATGCLFAGLCYAEFASMIPVAGSAYTYAYTTMGQFVAWIVGWDLVLEYALGAATVSISWSRYLEKLLGYYDMHIPPQLLAGPFEGGMFNLPAVLIVIAISLLLIRGTQESAILNGIIVTLKVGVVLVFIAMGWSYINPANHTPYIPENTGEFGHFGYSGIFRAAGVIFFAYIGFDAVSTAAQEAKNPRRDLPIGILVSLGICTVLYILFAHVMTGLANYTEFQGKDGIAPVAVAVQHTPYVFLNKLLIIAILAGYSSVILVMLMGQSRVFFSMSMDKLLPKIFSDVHPTRQTPYKTNLFFMGFVALFAAFVPGKVVGELTSMGTLFAFAVVCAGVLVIRKTMPDVPRGFRTPWVPFVPIMGLLICVALMASLGWETWRGQIIWLSIGLLIYFLYGKNAANKDLAGKKVG